MGYKRLSEQPLTSVIKDEDSIIGVFEGKLGLANVANWLSKINASFDINVDSDTDEEYVLSITVGRKTVTTPNLKAVSILNARIELGHLYFDMSDGRIIDAGVVNSDAKKYGVCYDFKSKNPKLTRIGDAKYLKAEIANGADDTDVVNDFDKIYPWSDIKRCTRTNDGTITSYEGDPNYTENGSIGEVLTEIPEHYRMTYISEATGKIYHYASREKLNEYYKFVPKTYVGSFLMSDMNDTGIAESRGGDYYCLKRSYRDARKIAAARGEGWHMMDIWDYETIKTLFMIEFATIDSQSLFVGNELGAAYSFEAYADEECMKDVLLDEEQITDTEFKTTSIVLEYPDLFVGDEIDIVILSNDNPGELDYEYQGEYGAVRTVTAVEPIDITEYPDFPDAVRCYISGNPITVSKNFGCALVTSRNGNTNVIKASSGRLLRYENGEGEPPSEGTSVWRGIENLVGEGYTWLDGILLYNGKYWTCNDITKYDNTIYKRDADGNVTEEYQYTPIPFDYPTVNGYITKMGYDETTGLTLPIETGGTSDTGYCDNFTRPRSNTQIFAVRYGGTHTPGAGLFHFSCYLTATANTQFYARLSYRHY